MFDWPLWLKLASILAAGVLLVWALSLLAIAGALVDHWFEESERLHLHEEEVAALERKVVHR